MLNLCMLYLLFWGKWHQSRQKACLCILLFKNELFYWAETLSRALSLNHIKTCSGFYLDTFAYQYLNGTFCIKQCCKFRGGSRIELAKPSGWLCEPASWNRSLVHQRALTNFKWISTSLFHTNSDTRDITALMYLKNSRLGLCNSINGKLPLKRQYLHRYWTDETFIRCTMYRYCKYLNPNLP